MAPNNISQKVFDVIIKETHISQRAEKLAINSMKLSMKELGDQIIFNIMSEKLPATTTIKNKKIIINNLSTKTDHEINLQIESMKYGTTNRLVNEGTKYIAEVANGINQILVPGKKVSNNNKFLSRNISEPKIKKLLTSGYILGNTYNDIWKRQKLATAGEVRRNIIFGIIGEESKQDIINRISGIGGIITKSTRQTAILIRTLFTYIRANALLLLCNNNPDTIKGFKAFSVFDSKTSLICKKLGSSAWTLDKKPISHKYAFPGSPPWHYNCRTLIAPLFYTKKEILDKLYKEKYHGHLRNRLYTIMENDNNIFDTLGQDQKAPNYAEWFNAQPANVQIKIIGARKYELWKNNKLPFNQIILNKKL